MPKYPRLPRAVYAQRVDTVKQLALWSSLGKLSPYGYYVFHLHDLVDKPGNDHGHYVFSLVDKPGIHEIWNLTLNFTMKININQSPKQHGS